jgi:hypothetical protein
MRVVRYSRTFYEELATLLEQGVARFGVRVVGQKRDQVLKTITGFLVHFPVRSVDPDLGIYSYHVTGTPFMLVYDYDDFELRIHLIFHGIDDRTQIDLSKVIW